MTLEYPLWKKAIIFVVLAFGLLYSLPNIYPQDPAVQISASRNAVLDDATKEKVQGDLERAKIAFKSIELSDKRLLVRLVDGETQLRASEMLRTSLGENYSVALNLASTVPGWLSSLGAHPMTLGLDLQGGVHFLMEVDSKAVIEAADERLVDDIKTMLRDKDIRGTAVRAADGVLVTLRNADDRKKAAGEIATLAAGVQLLDLPGTVDSFPMTVKVPQEARIASMDQVIEQNLSTLRNRINALGVAEPVIQ
nr:protein translocase subunit SecD [Xanthomonadales bacterium]